MTALLSIGYSAVADNLHLSGSASVIPKPYKGVYIKSVERVTTSNSTVTENDYVLPTNHLSSAYSNASNGTVTYKITVYNNTELTYWYAGERYESTYGDNSLIGKSGGVSIVTKDHQNDTSETFNSDDWIPPQTEREFYVVYTYGQKSDAPISLMVNFHFDLRIDYVHDEFLAVLNNVISPTSYDSLTAVLDAEYKKNGSLSISSTTHQDEFASFFGDLMVDIDGTMKKATVTIRRENLDKNTTTGDNYQGGGPSGCEYTLYITVENPTPGASVTVYAIAYSEGADAMGDDWYQVGELYEGTAKINADGSIDYSTWVAKAKSYEIADGIVYNVGLPNGDQYDIMKTMEQLISAQDQDIFNDIDNKNIFKKVYDIIQKHKGSSDPAVMGLRQAFTDASKFYVNHNNGQEFKVVRNKYTRAEIIYALKNIQKALDYYYQAYPNI